MSRYIDAIKLKSDMMEAICQGYTEEDMLGIVNEQDTADVVEVKHGHWINERLVTTADGRIYGIATCSVCKGSYVYVLDVWNYCPNCGANMDEVTE